jgi:hypothetical protein
MTLNEIPFYPATSMFLSVVDLVLKSPHATQHMILCIESSGRYNTISSGNGILQHRKGKLTIAKLKSSCLSYDTVVSRILESVLSKISRYNADKPDSVVSFILSPS